MWMMDMMGGSQELGQRCCLAMDDIGIRNNLEGKRYMSFMGSDSTHGFGRITTDDGVGLGEDTVFGTSHLG